MRIGNVFGEREKVRAVRLLRAVSWGIKEVGEKV